ncbi:MAG: ABC transporter transmembrane domain-containing protein, partial [Algiphilus sp.]
MTLAVAAGFGVGLCVIGQAMGIAWIVHSVVTRELSVMQTVPTIAAVATLLLLRGLLHYAQQRAAARVSQQRIGQIRNALLTHLHAAGPARIAQWHQADLASRAVHAVDAIGPYIAHYRPQRTLAVGVPLLVGIAAALHDWLVALLLFASAPLIPLFMALVGWGAERLSARFEQQRARSAGVFGDRIRGLLTLRLFHAEAAATQQVRHFSEALRADSMRVLRVAFLSSAVLEFFASVAVAAVAIYVGMGLLGYLDIGPAAQLSLYSGLCVLLLAPEFFAPLRQLATHYHDRAAALGAAEQLAPLFALPAMAETRAEAATPVPTTAAAVFEGVSLRREHG